MPPKHTRSLRKSTGTLVADPSGYSVDGIKELSPMIRSSPLFEPMRSNQHRCRRAEFLLSMAGGPPTSICFMTGEGGIYNNCFVPVDFSADSRHTPHGYEASRDHSSVIDVISTA